MTQYVRVVARNEVTRLLFTVKNPQAEICDQRLNLLIKTWGKEGNLRQGFHHLFVMFLLRLRLFILKSCYDVLCILCEPVENAAT